jgi:two-component system sensor histidine kinase BaeS
MKIKNKLFSAFILATVIQAIAMYTLMQWSFDNGIAQYTTAEDLKRQKWLIPELAKHYAEHENWFFLSDNLALRRELFKSNFDLREQGRHSFRKPNMTMPNDRGERSGPPPAMIILLDKNKNVIFGRYERGQKTPLLPINSIAMPERIIGFLTVAPRAHISEAFNIEFVQKEKSTFLYLTLIIFTISIVISYILSNAFTRPILDFGATLHNLASGKFKTKVTYNSQDELGILADDINHLGDALMSYETPTSRWIANISHELRTPITLMRAEVDAMIDGITQLDVENLKFAKNEILHLQSLVEDLHFLSMSDIGAFQYRMIEVDLITLIQEQVDKMTTIADEKKITISFQSDQSELIFKADPTKVIQMVTNLISNSIKYTEKGGRIEVRLTSNILGIMLNINDSFPCVDEAHIPKLMEPLYRPENSRNKKIGGSGLGLAICKAIVVGHHGEISLSQSYLGGLNASITLPWSE